MDKIKEVIVVEGRDDTANLRRILDVDTIETNGSAVNRATLEQIRHAQQKRGVIIFTDPDYPGKRIRHIVDQAVPGCKHAFLTQDDARSKHARHASLGVEHASSEVIERALADVYALAPAMQSDITREDLVDYGLIGGANAASRRAKLQTLLQIGHVNGKQLLKRLTMFGVTKQTFDRAMQQVLEEEQWNE